MGRRAVIFHDLVKLGQGMVGDEREHVVLNVVVHVPVEKAIERVGQEGSRVETVVEDVLGKAGVLGQSEERHKPGSEEVGQSDEEEGKPTLKN